MELSKLLAVPHLSLITRRADHELARVQNLIEHKVLVDGRADVEEVLGRLLALPGRPTPKTLDLIGHASPERSLLVLGDWVIDGASPTVTAFFRELADNDVIAKLGIRAVRLLGCLTADSAQGRSTLRILSEILEVEVYGATDLLYSAHYDAGGFRDDCQHVLTCASDLSDATPARERPDAVRYPRLLDVDALPHGPLRARAAGWPRRIATIDATRQLLGLVHRNAGAEMPGLLAVPSCELALPTQRDGSYHVVHVLLDGEFIRVYPDGDETAGVLYPTVDPAAVRRLIAELPPS